MGYVSFREGKTFKQPPTFKNQRYRRCSSGLPSICKYRSGRFWKLTTTLIFINKSYAEEPKKCVATDFAVILGYGVYSKMSFLYTYFLHEQRLSST